MIEPTDSIDVGFVCGVVLCFVKADGEILSADVHVLESIDLATLINAEASRRRGTCVSLKTTNQHELVVWNIDRFEVPWNLELRKIVFVN
jgi:hypothetical protein